MISRLNFILYSVAVALYNLFSKISLADYKLNLKNYTIIVPQSNNFDELSAAQLLQKYLNLVFEISVPISTVRKSNNREIFIGEHELAKEYEDTAEDRILIKEFNGNILLYGNSKLMLNNCIYVFLEKFVGVEMLTKNVTEIPSLKYLLIQQNIHYLYTPSFSVRTIYSSEGLFPEYIDWHRLQAPFENRIAYVHSFDFFVPPEKYFKTNPDYFALIDNKRSSLQLCLTNEGVMDVFVKSLKGAIAKWPNNKYWSVSQNDNLKFCECKNCSTIYKRGNGFSETLFRFVNIISSQFPEKIISTLAYLNSINPPKLVKINKNVEIIFCVTHLNRNFPITDFKENANLFRNSLSKWQALTSNILIWDYIVNYQNSLSPFPNLHNLKANLKYYKSININKIYLQGIGDQVGEFSELKSFLCSKLLWDVDIDFEAEKKQFCNKFFGSAGPYITEYISLLENEAKRTNANVDIWAEPIMNISNFLSAQNIKRFKELFNKALVISEHNDDQYKRVLKESLAVRFAEIEIERTSKINPNLTSDLNLSQFYKDCKSVDIKYLRNGARTPKDFIEEVVKYR